MDTMKTIAVVALTRLPDGSVLTGQGAQPVNDEK